MRIENKTINEITQTFLFAYEGKVITNGKDVYGKVIRLASGVSEADFYEITDEEYNNILQDSEDSIIL